MKKDKLMLFVVLVLTVQACGSSEVTKAQNPSLESQDLILKVSPTKSAYKISDPVELDFTVENKGTAQVVVPRRLKLRTNIRLEIQDQEGRAAKWCGRLADELILNKNNYRTLLPGESLHRRLTVSCETADLGRGWGYKISVPGKYSVRADYQLLLPKKNYEQAFPGARVITGPVSAEPITIELK